MNQAPDALSSQETESLVEENHHGLLIKPETRNRELPDPSESESCGSLPSDALLRANVTSGPHWKLRRNNITQVVPVTVQAPAGAAPSGNAAGTVSRTP